MGYSPQKKQLDLKDFLSQPAKKGFRKGVGFRRAPTNPTPVKTGAKQAVTK
ncbi:MULTISPECIES: hypothetical protein [unclassified Thioclava]|uniref:hypothetical protein n=1 Tax=unclassified Thioclava TaxID=2621713 RepID=UPI00143C31CF|nr:MULTISPECIES: hypothetical protein [unclassified Thioclava]